MYKSVRICIRLLHARLCIVKKKKKLFYRQLLTYIMDYTEINTNKKR